MRTCADVTCTYQLVSKFAYDRADAAQRSEWLRTGVRPHGSRGLCSACTRRPASLPGARKMHPVSDVAEEYMFLAAQGESFDQIAARLGMRKHTLQRSLQRARQRGLLAA